MLLKITRYGEEIARLEMARVETRRGLDAARKGNVAKAVLEDTKASCFTSCDFV